MVAMSDPGTIESTDSSTVENRPWKPQTLAVLVAAIALPVALVVAVLLAVTGLLGWLLAIVLGLLVGIGLGVFLVVRRMNSAAETVLAQLPPDARRYDRIDNLVDGLRLTAGVSSPSIHIIEDAAANAMAVSRDLEHTLVLTTGLVDCLDLVSLEGVVAELMVRLRNGEAERDTIDVALSDVPLVPVPGLASVVKAAGGWARRIGPSEIDRENDDIVADYRAVLLTRYPPGLRTALERIKEVGSRPATESDLASLWIVDPNSSNDDKPGERPSLDLRIDALAEL